MAEVTFPEVKDRNVATPSRVRITKAVGIEGDDIYDVEAIPGTVYEEGTPLNKEFFDALKRYIDASSGAGEIVGIAYGGTGADNVADARTNLEVYSKAEVDEELDRTAGLIEPHITRRVTDSTDGVHGFYIDQNYTMWIDPDGDGVFEEMPSDIIGGGNNGELEDIVMRIGSFSNIGAGWNTFTYPTDQMLEDVPFILAWCENPDYEVQIKNPTLTSFLYQLVKPSVTTTKSGSYLSTAVHSYDTTSESLMIHYVAISYWGD